MVDSHGAKFIAFGFDGLVAHGRQERREQTAVLADSASRPERVTQERKAGVLVLAPTIPEGKVDRRAGEAKEKVGQAKDKVEEVIDKAKNALHRK